MINPDKNAIEAVQQGDRDRFAELVERHQRMVYAISWSYLGDVELSEDAAQETFLKAFRYLRALRDPERFAGWLARIARNVSATLLRRRRTELVQRRRWQLEQAAPVAQPPGNADAQDERDALRRGLSDLPAQHRECLVLFYLEGKSIRDGAAMLGIAEEAFKTRLHRARRALRGQLERQMEEGLGRLEPRKNFSASVMLLVSQQSLGFAGVGGVSLGGKAVSWLGGLWAGFALMFWMAIWQAGTFYVIMGWFSRLESSNLIDKPENEFRKGLLKRNHMQMTLSVLCAMGAMFLVLTHLSFAGYFQILAVYSAWGGYAMLRLLRVNRSPFVRGQALTMVVFTVLFALIGFLGAPFALFFAAMLGLNLVLMRTNRSAPRRNDYNLFLRQTKGMLGEPEADPHPTRAATENELRAFARFLGDQWLVRDYRLKGPSIHLQLTPVRMTLWQGLLSLAGRSVVVVRNDGACRAMLAWSDRRALKAIGGGPIDAQALESAVAGVVRGTLTHFLRGETDEARRLLSTTPDEAIFIEDFAKTRAYRWQTRLAVAGALIALVAFSFMPGAWRWGGVAFPAWRTRPVSIAMARKAVGEWIRDERPAARPQLHMLWGGSVHPSMALIGEDNADAYRRSVADALRKEFDERNEGASEARIVTAFLEPHLLYHALATPILTRGEVTALGFEPERVRAVLGGLHAPMREKVFGIPSGSVTFGVPPEGAGAQLQFRTLDLETIAMRLWLFKAFDCLDLADREDLTRQIAKLQVTDKFQLPEGFPPLDTTRAIGLFDGGICNLRSTWAALFALESLGRPEAIDREACIQGLLRNHRGKGVFRADVPRLSTIRINGRDDDAFFGMESLALLGALDRIDDLRRWQFHPEMQLVRREGEAPRQSVTAEAFLRLTYQERLDRRRQGLGREDAAIAWRR